MKETLGGNNDGQPDQTPEILVEGVAIDHPLGYFTRKKYSDGVRVWIEPYGDTSTFYPDGGIHRDHPANKQESYTPPQDQP